MNAPVGLIERPAIKLTAPYFLMLQGFGAFDAYWKVELLDGELWGVPAEEDEEPQSDSSLPIKLTTEHYELLARAGAFIEHRRTELIDGVVYAMSPQYRQHGFVKDQLAYRIRRSLEEIGSPLQVATEQSVALERFSEPEPDVIVTTEPYGVGPIPGASVALLVEVSDSTSKFDRVRKAFLYACAGVAEYWIADVNRRTILRLAQPERGGYLHRDTIPFGERLASKTIEGLEISTEGL